MKTLSSIATVRKIRVSYRLLQPAESRHQRFPGGSQRRELRAVPRACPLSPQMQSAISRAVVLLTAGAQQAAQRRNEKPRKRRYVVPKSNTAITSFGYYLLKLLPEIK